MAGLAGRKNGGKQGERKLEGGSACAGDTDEMNEGKNGWLVAENKDYYPPVGSGSLFGTGCTDTAESPSASARIKKWGYQGFSEVETDEANFFLQNNRTARNAEKRIVEFC